MTSEPRQDDDLGESLGPGGNHYRAWVGPPRLYDRVGAMQFVLLALLGLREHNTVLDIGCGSLRAGRLWIMYLRPEKYYGIEPVEWVLRDGLRKNIGNELLATKKPSFSNNDDFELTTFGRKFDYLIAQSVFSHAPISQISRCLEQARKAMHNQSILAATFVNGDTDHDGSEWVYPGGVRYTQRTISHLVQNVGLEPIFIDWPHPNGQRWFIAKDPACSFDWTALRTGSTFSFETHLNEIAARHEWELKTYEEYLQDQLVQIFKHSAKSPQ